MKPVYASLFFLAACLPACAGSFFDSSPCPTTGSGNDNLGYYLSNYGDYVDSPPYFNGCSTTTGLGYGGFWWSAIIDSGSPTATSPNNITVTPDGSFGFDFGFGDTSVAAGEAITYQIGYTIIDPPPIVGGDLGFDPTGDVTASFAYCSNSDGSDYANALTFYTNVDSQGCGDPSNQVDMTSSPQTLFTLDLINGPTSDSGTFAGGPYSEVGILITITLTGGDTGATFEGITADPELQDETPEPGAFWLVGSALAGLALVQIRRRRARA